MKNCIFCKIIKGEIPCHKIYEDENSIGILDVFPNTEGQSLVIAKNHYPSDFTKMPEEEFQKFLLSAKKLSELLKEKLEVQRVALVIEGTGINHAHIKLYPMYGLMEEFEQIIAPERVYYDKYPGFIDTRSGSKAEDKDLEKIVAKIFDKD
jgi:diadenosine tetraphosphate (Ap4A) HIT family hydrolase